MAKQMLADLSDGMGVQTLAYVKSKRLQPYKNKPGQFLILALADRSGTMDAKAFDNAEEFAGRIAEGTVVNVSGRASAYQGVLGMILDDVLTWQGEYDPADFLPTYAGDVAALEAKLDALIISITDPELSLIIRAIFADPDLRRKYVLAPAAKGVHGAYIHGLLEHVTRQAELAEAACRCYPQAHRDMVIAGVLLHDIGKTVEFSWDLAIAYTPLGSLVGHAVIGDRLICERGREVGISEETTMRLRHLVLSHHGTREFGAVTLPQTLEAVILHSVDNLEARATHCIEVMNSANPEAIFSEYDRIEGRYWYRGPREEAVEAAGVFE